MKEHDDKIIQAVINGNKEELSQLIEAKGNVNHVDGLGRSSLEWAKLEGRKECVEILEGKKKQGRCRIL